MLTIGVHLSVADTGFLDGGAPVWKWGAPGMA